MHNDSKGTSSGGRAAPDANLAQVEAIHIYTGETLVLAGPGSGKTYVLTAHIETLIKTHHVDPSSILVLTFSRAAALSMRSRFYKNTRGRYPPIAFGTFHSTYYQIIRRGGSNPISLIAPARRYRLLQELQRQYLPACTDPDDVDTLDEIIRRSREQGRPYLKGDFKQPEVVMCAVRTYETYLAENHLIDYDGMILLCRDMLRRDPELLRQIQEQCAFILVDEFQDISAVQYEILRMLYDRKGSSPRALFVVGDDDQSIYGFRGANPSICRDFLRDYPDARPIMLTINYRSVPGIVRTAGRVIGENQNRIHKNVVSGRSIPVASGMQQEQAAGRSRAVVCKAFTHRREQADYLVNVISSMDERTRTRSAVICRTNRQVGFFRQALVQAGLLEEGTVQNENPWIPRVRMLYRAYMELGRQIRQGTIHRETYRQIMNCPERFLLQESMPCEEMARGELLAVYARGTPAWQAMQSLLDSAERLCDLQEEQRIRFFRTAIGVEEDLIRRSGGSEQMRHQIAEAFAELAANPRGDPSQAMEGMAEKQNQPQGMTLHGGISLMTMHACKGLEFDCVYLPDLNEGILPSRKAHSPADIEEERRLFYVAMTRARNHLELLYVRGTEENVATPTRFLLPLGIGPQYTQ